MNATKLFVIVIGGNVVAVLYSEICVHIEHLFATERVSLSNPSAGRPPPSPLPLRPVVVAMVTASLWDIKGVFNHGVIASLQQSVTYFGLKIERICLFFTNHLLFFHPCTLWGRQWGVNPNNRTMKACILSGGVAIYTFMIKARPNKETNES